MTEPESKNTRWKVTREAMIEIAKKDLAEKKEKKEGWKDEGFFSIVDWLLEQDDCGCIEAAHKITELEAKVNELTRQQHWGNYYVKLCEEGKKITGKKSKFFMIAPLLFILRKNDWCFNFQVVMDIIQSPSLVSPQGLKFVRVFN